MKYEEVYDFNNLMKSAKACEKGVMWKCSAQMFEINKLRWIARLKKDLESEEYKSKGFNEFTINERGKMRFIQSVHISERCVQKSLSNNILKPLIVPKLIYDNSASLKSKGTEFALERLKCHLEKHYHKHGVAGGILIMDFSNYFGSIDHEKLLELVRTVLKDERLYKMMKDFVKAFGDRGLGLGSEISQICAIYFPNILDHYVKEQLHIKGYGRYMDDSYIIHEDIEYLKKCKTEIIKICEALDITLKEKRTVIVKFSTGSFSYLKKRIRLQPNGKVVMRLSRKNIADRRRKLKKQKKMLDLGKIPMKSVEQSYQSWRGYAAKYDSYNTIKNMDNLFKELFGKEPQYGQKRNRKRTKANPRANQRSGAETGQTYPSPSCTCTRRD